jgi:hypothetical protein
MPDENAERPPLRTSVAALQDADWDQVERDLIITLRSLRLIALSLPRTAAGDKIANDLILPAMELAGAFCVTVEVHEATVPIHKG